MKHNKGASWRQNELVVAGKLFLAWSVLYPRHEAAENGLGASPLSQFQLLIFQPRKVRLAIHTKRILSPPLFADPYPAVYMFGVWASLQFTNVLNNILAKTPYSPPVDLLDGGWVYG